MESIHGRRLLQKEVGGPTERSIHEFAAIRRTTGMSCFGTDEWWRGARSRDSWPDKRRVIAASDNFRRAHDWAQIIYHSSQTQVMPARQQLTRMWPSGPADSPESLSNNGLRVKSNNDALVSWSAIRHLRFPSSDIVTISQNYSDFLTSILLLKSRSASPEQS